MNKFLLYFVFFGLLSTYNANAQGIQVTTHEYTSQELVKDILINNTCNQVFNITSSTGSDFGSNNGIGYFTNTNENFPMVSGIILSTGDALFANGPNDFLQISGNWPGDDQLFNYIQGLGIDPELLTYVDATILEFDFIPFSSTMSFDFIFVSEEYGEYQCDFADAFAFFLTNLETNETINLATVPNTDDPISVISIRDQTHNTNCSSSHPEYFNAFYGYTGIPADIAPHNFNGETVKMTALHEVIPGTTYHIKLVIADRNDHEFDSAVFIEAGSFNIGQPNIDDYLISDGTALCEGEETSISLPQIELPGVENILYTWSYNNVPLDNQSNVLTFSEPGEYSVVVDYFLQSGDNCVISSTFIVEVYEFPEINESIDLLQCSAIYDLTMVDTSLLGIDSDFTLKYFTNLEDAENNVNEIQEPTSFLSTGSGQTIYFSIYYPALDCAKVFEFKLFTEPLIVAQHIPAIQSCSIYGEIATFDLTTNQNDITNAHVEFAYFTSEENANNRQNEISNPFAYQATNQETIWVVVSEINDPSCFVITNFMLEFHHAFEIELNATYSICDSPITLGPSTTYVSYMWSTDETTQTISVSEPGEYTLTVTNDEGCTAFQVVNVVPGFSPEITSIQYGTDHVLLFANGGVEPYKFSQGGYIWQVSNQFNNLAPGTYDFYVKGEDGCVSNAFKIVIYQIPTLFTPNDDGINDVWRIPGLEIYPGSSISIWDRYGKLIFQGIPSNSEVWNGKDLSGNKVPTQDYWYHLILTDGREFIGHVTVKNRKR